MLQFRAQAALDAVGKDVSVTHTTLPLTNVTAIKWLPDSGRAQFPRCFSVFSWTTIAEPRLHDHKLGVEA